VTEADLAKFPLLAALGESERAAVADELESIEVAAGEHLFREGERADGALFVAAGRVRVYSVRVGMEAEFGAGETLGTLSLVLDGPREASAETLSRAHVWRLRRRSYRRLAASSPAAACSLIEGVLREYAAHVREEIARSLETVDGGGAGG